MDRNYGQYDAPFRVTAKQEGSEWILTLSGSLGMDDCSPLRKALEHAVATQPRAIILDVAGLEFMSSMGLGIIVWAQIRCRYHKGVVRLVGPGPFVLRLLETTNLIQIFPPFASVEEASRP